MEGVSIQNGLCQCGCGQPTDLVTQYRKGYKIGQSLRFRHGHIGGLNATATYESKIEVGEDGLGRKNCTLCKQLKLLEDFNKSATRREKRRAHCKMCERKQARDFYKSHPDPYKWRARAFNKKMTMLRLAEADRIKREKGCLLCGEKVLCVLDFHHRHGNSKGREGGKPVSRAAGNSHKQFMAELAKCVVLCANCHRKVHAGVARLPDSVEDLSLLVRDYQRNAG